MPFNRLAAAAVICIYLSTMVGATFLAYHLGYKAGYGVATEKWTSLIKQMDAPDLVE